MSPALDQCAGEVLRLKPPRGVPKASPEEHSL